MQLRKIFDLNTKRSCVVERIRFSPYFNTISAGGCLFVKRDEGKVKVLLNYNTSRVRRHMYEDYGGKVELYDKNIYETICREVKEETKNFVDVTKYTPHMAIYSQSSKYYYMICIVDDNFPDNKLFEDESKWFTIEELYVIRTKISSRLEFKVLVKYLETL